MPWPILLLAGAVAGRVILAALRSNPQTSVARALLFEFGMRRARPGLALSRHDRVWNGLAMLVSALTLVALGAAAMVWALRYPNLSTANHVLTGIGFVLAMVGVVVALAGLVELVRAPFAPKASAGAA